MEMTHMSKTCFVGTNRQSKPFCSLKRGFAKMDVDSEEREEEMAHFQTVIATFEQYEKFSVRRVPNGYRRLRLISATSFPPTIAGEKTLMLFLWLINNSWTLWGGRRSSLKSTMRFGSTLNSSERSSPILTYSFMAEVAVETTKK